MKAKYYDMGMRVARRLFAGIDDAEADLVVTDCSLAALQIEQGTGREALHPIEGRQAGLRPVGAVMDQDRLR